MSVNSWMLRRAVSEDLSRVIFSVTCVRLSCLFCCEQTRQPLQHKAAAVTDTLRGNRTVREHTARTARIIYACGCCFLLSGVTLSVITLTNLIPLSIQVAETLFIRAEWGRTHPLRCFSLLNLTGVGFVTLNWDFNEMVFGFEMKQQIRRWSIVEPSSFSCDLAMKSVERLKRLFWEKKLSIKSLL